MGLDEAAPLQRCADLAHRTEQRVPVQQLLLAGVLDRLQRLGPPRGPVAAHHVNVAVGRDLLKELPSLSKGQVIVSGASVNTPVMLRVRTRITEHGGESIDAPQEWLQWFEDGQPQTSAREAALFAGKQINYEEDGDILFATGR